VKVRRLDSTLRQHASDLREIDIVCVDVEGWELEFLSGLSFGVYKPKLLIVENLFLDPAHQNYLAQKGYDSGGASNPTTSTSAATSNPPNSPPTSA
jgi:hypothetical protein